MGQLVIGQLVDWSARSKYPRCTERDAMLPNPLLTSRIKGYSTMD